MGVRRAEGDWGGAFTVALTASWERVPSLRAKILGGLNSSLSGGLQPILDSGIDPSLPAPPPPPLAAAAALDLLPPFLAAVLRTPAVAAGRVGASATATAEGERTHAIRVAHAVIAVCLAADGLHRLYSSDVYDALIALPHIKAAFLELLVPHILADRLSSLPPEVMQSLVDHFVHLGRPAAIERCPRT
jgi:hypothetical protein